MPVLSWAKSAAVQLKEAALGLFALVDESHIRTVAIVGGGVVLAASASLLTYHVAMSIKYYNQPWFSFSSSGIPKSTAYYMFEDERFFDLSNIAWVGELEDKWKVIEAELQRFIRDKPVDFQPYFRPDLVNRAGAWKTVGLKAWGLEDSNILVHFPETMKMLNDLPDHVVGVSFNRLEEHGQVKGHQGNTNGIMRFHLGLKVPADPEHCYFQVSSEKRPWEEGKLFAFCDAHWHTAINGTNESRYILLFDVIRPQFAHMRHYICARVLGDLALQYYAGRSLLVKLALRLSRPVTRFILYNAFVPIFHIMVQVNPDILSIFS